MDYLGIGFSNIRLPDDENNWAYRYNYRINTFPEEVFIHEFLHTLERNSKEYDLTIPALHDYAKYGYTEDKLNGQKKWYQDYMNQNINSGNKKIGLTSEIFQYKPVHESNFKYAYNIKAFKEPENIIEIIQSLAKRVISLFDKKQELNEIEN